MGLPDPLPPARPVRAFNGGEYRALAWCALGAVAAIAWLAFPVATGLFLGALMGFTLQPAYEKLARLTRRPWLASLTLVLATTVAIVGAVAGFISLFVKEAVAVTKTLLEELRPGGALSEWVQTVTGWLGRFGFSPEALTDRMRDAATEIGSRSAAVAAAVATGTFVGLLNLFFALLSMHLILRHWERMVAKLEVVSPLRPEYTRALLAEFRRVGRTTLFGTVMTGLAQGALAAVGYWATGVPRSLFFGIATAIASVVPAVGTLLVWVPAGLFLFASGYPALAIAELVWGAVVVVGFSDYVIRPRLVGDEAMPALLTFLALFGGLEVLGLRGLIVGPVVMALAVAILRLYGREAEARRTVKLQ
jgi:predicted PurR-regulated permease PerM